MNEQNKKIIEEAVKKFEKEMNEYVEKTEALDQNQEPVGIIQILGNS